LAAMRRASSRVSSLTAIGALVESGVTVARTYPPPSPTLLCANKEGNIYR
jgi:hypothetical protein